MRLDRRETSIAAGSVKSAARPTTSAAQALRLLLDVGTASRRGWDRPADDAGDCDQGQDVRQRLKEEGRVPPRLGEAERERRRGPEEQCGGECPERAPVAEDDRREGDEAATGGHVLAERAEIADREIRAAERGQHSREDDGRI